MYRCDRIANNIAMVFVLGETSSLLFFIDSAPSRGLSCVILGKVLVSGID